MHTVFYPFHIVYKNKENDQGNESSLTISYRILHS